MLKTIKKNGGATVTINSDNSITQHNFKSGYMVSLKDHETILENPTQEQLSNVLLELNKIKPKEAFIGLWLNEDKLFIDISIKVENKQKALALARQEKQLAIYDNKKQKSIYLKNA